MRFSNYAFKTNPGVTSLTAPNRWGDIITTNNFGPIADGSSHPLGDRYSSLMQARGDYPFVTSLSQEIDWAACQLASNVAFGPPGAEHGSNNVQLNRNIQIDNGAYFFGDDTWLIRNLASARIIGDGQLASRLTGNGIVLQFDGLWYSVLESFTVESIQPTAIAALDIDGNVPGHPYPTRGVQGVDLVNMSIFANGGTYAFALCRQGGSNAQGSECQYRDVHLSGASQACYYQNGFNNISNMFLGGDMQSYTKNGIESSAGTIHVIGTSFESTSGFTQYLNDGHDIRIGDAGAYDGCIIHGCRSESMRFLLNSGAVIADVRACTGRAALAAWAAGVLYAINEVVLIQASKQIFKVTIGGTSGGSEPTWPATGTITDGGVTWEFVDFNYIENNNGNVDLETCTSLAGRIVYSRFGVAGQAASNTITSDTNLKDADNILFVDATSGPVQITIPTPDIRDRTRIFTIKKIDTSANAVTVAVADSSSVGAQFEGGGSTDTIAGGSRGYRTYSLNNQPGGTSPRWWYTIASG